jgi:hypothetical protein
MQPSPSADSGRADESAWLARAAWWFVAFGVALRLLTFAANPPLWGDEACLAYNLLDRGYLDLLRPLDYGQVAPPLFLWAERAIVDALGFSEATLRLFPLACGVASLFLFRRLAGLMLRGVPELLAVAVFAVSVHPIRHSCDVKPYASDLLTALVLTTPAVAWLRDRRSDAPLWALAALAPIALLMSYPSVFVAGGVTMALAWPAWASGRSSTRLAFAAFVLTVAGSAQAVFSTVARSPDATVRAWMDLYWSRAYPPAGVGPFLKWLLLSISGSMLSYPDGGREGGSVGTFLCVLVGAMVLVRSRRRAELALLLIPLALALAASFGHRYPFGGEARTMQFVAPAVCLLMGLGLATLIRFGSNRLPLRRVGTAHRPEDEDGGQCPPYEDRWRPAFLRVALVALAALGLIETGQFLRRPYRSSYDERARAFARAFWPEQARDAEVACVRRDFGVVEAIYARLGVLNGRTPVFVCNERIYGPWREGGPRLDRVSASHPLRCVLYNETAPEQPEVAAWLAEMGDRFDLARTGQVDVTVSDPGTPPKVETIRVFDFVPKGAVAVGDLPGQALR